MANSHTLEQKSSLSSSFRPGFDRLLAPSLAGRLYARQADWISSAALILTSSRVSMMPSTSMHLVSARFIASKTLTMLVEMATMMSAEIDATIMVARPSRVCGYTSP